MTNISIRTIHIPATNTAGTRYSATVRSGEFKGKQITISPDISIEDPYGAAAEALADRLNITDGSLVCTIDFPNGRIYELVPALATEDNIEVAEEIGVPAEEDAPAPIQAVTRYVGPDGLKGSRVGARMLNGPFSGKRVTIGYDYAARDPHLAAVHALLAKVGVDGSAVDSGAGIGNGYIYDIVTG